MIDPSLTQLTCLLDALQCGAALIDRVGVFRHVNPRLAEFAGRPAEQLIGVRVADLYTDPYALDRIRDVLRHFEEPAEGEFILERPDGTRVPVIFAGRPLRPNGAPDDAPAQYRVVTAVEITDQKLAYEEIARLGDTVLQQAVDLKRLNDTLESRVRERTQELHTANMEAITMLAVASEARDEGTGDHVRRIEAYASAVAREMGLSEVEAERIGYSAILHDVGKIHIPDEVLKKPGPLSDDERAVMQRHSAIGEHILSGQPFFDAARVIARSHHENWDGSGYPDGLAGEAIPLPARIVHVVDVYDALVSERVYKRAWTQDDAIAELHAMSGRMFEPAAVRAFVSWLERGAAEGVVR